MPARWLYVREVCAADWSAQPGPTGQHASVVEPVVVVASSTEPFEFNE